MSPCACGNPQRTGMTHTSSVCVTDYGALANVLAAVSPYPTGTGSSGSEASAEREQYRDTSGASATDQERTLAWLAHRGTHGATQAELQGHLDVGHGTASQVLSNLHQAGKVSRLVDKRLRSHVYVLPRFVADRPLSPYRRLLEAALEGILRDIPQYLPEYSAAVMDAKRVLHDRLEN